MRFLKIIIGLACFIVAIPTALVALACFSNLGTVDPLGSFLGSSVIAILAIGLAVTAGWFLIARRNSNSKSAGVIMVLAIFAGILPALRLFWAVSHVESFNRGAAARSQMQQLELSIRLYQEEFGRFPIPANITNFKPNDFTFGTHNTSVAKLGITNASGSQANNSALVAVLLAWTNCPDFLRISNVKHKFPGTNSEGVLLDPWGNPYIITIDLNGDDKCRDAFYQLASVSEMDSNAEHFCNLTRPTPPPYQTPETRDSFEAPGTVMVWSFGPDGKADSSRKANTGVNKDNILRIDGSNW